MPAKNEKILIKFSKEDDLSEQENHDRFIENLKGSIRIVTVEPLMALFVVVVYLQNYVMPQYILFRIQKDYNIVPNDTLAFVCKPDQNNTDKADTDKIQSLNAQYRMYIQISTCICTIMTAPFYCVFSDRYGRKMMFLIPTIGVFLKSLFEVFILVFNWPIYTFIITEGFYGLCGGFPFGTGLAYTYVADITTKKSRTRRLAILEVIMSIATLCVSLFIGYWITKSGYLYPYILSTAVALLCVLYTIFVLKEPLKMDDPKANRIPPKQQFKRLFTVYLNRPRLQRALLIIIVIMYNFYFVAEMSNVGLSNIYLMSYPICMNPLDISIFGFLNMLMINLGIGITVYILVRWFSDLVLVLVCLLSGIGFSIQMGLATTPLATYIAAGTNLLSFSAFTFVRGYLSKRVGPGEQGAIFGGIILSETYCNAITKVVTIYVYGATFRIFHGMVYFFISGFGLVAMILTIVAIILGRKIDAIGLSINSETM